MTISFKVSAFDADLIEEIAKRAVKNANLGGDKLEISMDITAIHVNGCPLDLEKFLAFPNFDFHHDIFGIRNHIDRKSGKLLDCFLPRCAVTDSA